LQLALILAAFGQPEKLKYKTETQFASVPPPQRAINDPLDFLETNRKMVTKLHTPFRKFALPPAALLAFLSRQLLGQP
jgi:hypothetical protein